MSSSDSSRCAWSWLYRNVGAMAVHPQCEDYTGVEMKSWIVVVSCLSINSRSDLGRELVVVWWPACSLSIDSRKGSGWSWVAMQTFYNKIEIIVGLMWSQQSWTLKSIDIFYWPKYLVQNKLHRSVAVLLKLYVYKIWFLKYFLLYSFELSCVLFWWANWWFSDIWWIWYPSIWWFWYLNRLIFSLS